jgi:predicted regulator of Ras-like GTPase activity (Roadblock/LC7/MglB family)
MDDCCYKGNLSTFKNEVNQVLGRLFSQYYNITFLAFLDNDGNVVDYQIHSSTQSNDSKKKLEEILKKALDFKISSTKAAKLLGYETASETFIRGDSHIITTYEINGYFLAMVIEMSKPLIDAFDFEKFNEKIELIILELKKKIENLKSLDRDND